MENKETQIKRAWYKKKRFLIPTAVLGLISISNAFSGNSYTQDPQKEATVQSFPIKTEEVLKTTNTTQTTPKSTTNQQSQPKKVESCNRNYSGCLNPNASDYDCRGGSGDGPYYTGQVTVLGYDEYGLDRDGDGIGCE